MVGGLPLVELGLALEGTEDFSDWVGVASPFVEELPDAFAEAPLPEEAPLPLTVIRSTTLRLPA